MTDNLESHSSLTPLAVQVNWYVPTEFPSCPDELTNDALPLYASRLSFGSVFARNRFSTSLVVDHRLKDHELIVLTRFAGKSVKDWAVIHVSACEGHLHHRSEGTFYCLQSALKHVCELAGEGSAGSIDELNWARPVTVAGSWRKPFEAHLAEL